MARLALVAAALMLALGRPAAQQPTFRAETELVHVGVVVTDRDGGFLTDLTADDFRVLEDDREQTVRYFARGDEGAAPELHVGLLFDTSGSMGDDIDFARTAAIRFLNRLQEARDITIVDFDTEVRVGRYQQQDFPRIVERIRTREPQGMTAMYDALAVYLDGAADQQGRKILVLFTDGGDTRSAIRFGDVITLIRASDATIFAIGFLEHQRGNRRTDQRLRLSQIATESGGEAFFPGSLERLDEAYDNVLAQIRAQYSLGYVSSNTTADGGWRKVEIQLRRPGLERARVQARKGYFAPYRP